MALGIRLLITTLPVDLRRLCFRLISELLDSSYQGAWSRSFRLLWAVSRKGGEFPCPNLQLYLIELGAFGACVMLHVVPFHEAFLTISPK